MRRKLNTKLLIGLLVGISIAGVGVHFLHAFQVERNAFRLLERADQAFKDQKDEKALEYYGQYLTLVPDDIEAMQKYATVLDRRDLDDGERVGLVLRMEQVLRAKPNEQAFRLRLVHNLIDLDRFSEAIDNLKKLQSSAPDKADVLHMIGWCQEANKDYRQAATSFEAAIRINPKQLRSYVLLAEVLADRLNQPEAAQKVMDDLVQANGDVYEPYLLRARFQRRRGDDQAAQADLATAYKLAPDQPDVILEVADVARAAGRWEEATHLLKDGMKRFPDQAVFYQRLAWVNLQTKNNDEAIRQIKEGIRRTPGSNELTILLIDLMIDQKQLKEARAKTDELAKAGWSPALVAYLNSRLAVADQQWNQAIPLVQSALKDLGETSEWHGRLYVLLGLCYRNLGDYEQELQACRRAVQAEPTWIMANLDLGAALLNNGRMDEASQTLEALQTAKDLPAEYWSLLARVRLWRQLRLPETDRRWTDVEAALAKADADNIDSAIVRAELLLARRDVAGVRACLEKARAAHPGDIAIVSALADLSQRERHFDDVLDRQEKQYATLVLKHAVKAIPLPPRDYRDSLWLARVYAATGDNAKAEEMHRLGLAQAGHAPDTWVAWVGFLHQASRHGEALKELDRMKTDLPANRQPLTLARCYEALQMPMEAMQAYQEAVQKAPDEFIVLGFAADFARRVNRVNEARVWYERLLDPELGAPAEYTERARIFLRELGKEK